MVTFKLNISEAKIQKQFKEEDILNQLDSKEAMDYLQKKENDAYQKGLIEGEQRGYKKKSDELKTLIDSINSLSLEFEKFKKRFYMDIEPQMVELSLNFAEKIIEQELLSGYVRLDRLIAPVIDDLKGATQIKIILNPEDFQEFSNMQADVMGENVSYDMTVTCDPSVAKGGCLIETDLGHVDSSLQTRINHLKDSVRD